MDAISNSTITFTDRATELMNAAKVSKANREAFSAILEKTADVKPEDARKVLNSLSAQEREVLRLVHVLADPINVSSLTEEGAYNLLTQPGSAKDLNNDGLLNIGAGKNIVFPPPNAPDAVKKAWEEATAGMSSRDKMLAQLTFLPIEASANVKYGDNGRPVGLYSPGDPEYVNIYAQSGFSYQNLVQKYLDYLDNTRAYSTPEKYQSQKAFAESFAAALARNGAV